MANHDSFAKFANIFPLQNFSMYGTRKCVSGRFLLTQRVSLTGRIKYHTTTKKTSTPRGRVANFLANQYNCHKTKLFNRNNIIAYLVNLYISLFVIYSGFK